MIVHYGQHQIFCPYELIQVDFMDLFYLGDWIISLCKYVQLFHFPLDSVQWKMCYKRSDQLGDTSQKPSASVSGDVMRRK